jgi:hypothetical protein
MYYVIAHVYSSMNIYVSKTRNIIPQSDLSISPTVPKHSGKEGTQFRDSLCVNKQGVPKIALQI